MACPSPSITQQLDVLQPDPGPDWTRPAPPPSLEPPRNISRPEPYTPDGRQQLERDVRRWVRGTGALDVDAEAEIPVRQWDDLPGEERFARRLSWHRSRADIIAPILADSWHPELKRAGEAMHGCSCRVRVMVDQDSGEVLGRGMWRCHGRWCPICLWRRSLRWRRLVGLAVDEMNELWPEQRYILVTLTVRNCEVAELRETVRAMSQAFARLCKRKRWPAAGYVRFLEVTRSRRGLAHPHLHVILAVPPDYFDPGQTTYLRQDEWVEMWREALGADYRPIVDVRAVKRRDRRGGAAPQSMAAAVAEIAKYPLKLTAAAVGDADWFRGTVAELISLRAVAAGGVFRAALRAASRKLEDRKALARLELAGRRVAVVWWHWSAGGYVRAPADQAEAWTRQLQAHEAGVFERAAA